MTNPPCDIKEWNTLEENVRTELTNYLLSLGISDYGLSYILNQTKYIRFPYIFSAWMLDRNRSLALAKYFCLHCIGIKILDDIIDQDHHLKPVELFYGIPLVHEYLRKIIEFSKSPEIAILAENLYKRVAYINSTCSRSEVIDIQGWIKLAIAETGELFKFYSQSACISANRHHLLQRAESFSYNFGILLVASDDIHDYFDSEEQNGNIANLVLHESVCFHSFESLIDESYKKTLESITNIDLAFDLIAIVDNKYQDIKLKIGNLKSIERE